MVLWSVEATQEERLSLAAGSTVYGVEGVDEVFFFSLSLSFFLFAL